MRHKTILCRSATIALLFSAIALPLRAQETPQPGAAATRPSGTSASPVPSPSDTSALQQSADAIENEVEQALWFLRVSDVASIDRFLIASSKPIHMNNPTGQGAGNPMIINFYTFTPKKLAAGHKAPLVLFVHGGVHSHFDLSYTHIIRELMDQGYVVVAPDYRGSTGYGLEFYNQID